MRRMNLIGSTAIAVLLTAGTVMSQQAILLGNNAALRYWAAFSQLQDSGITDQEAKELSSALDNMGPFDISKYDDLIRKNTPALEIMARGTLLPNCDWGLDYGLGGDLPVDYARKALVLGRLNVLYVMRLYHAGKKDEAIGALAAGLRFSRDVANGGSLFATLVAKELLVTHLIVVRDGVHMGQLSAAERSRLQSAVAALGDGLDWPTAAKRDIEALGSRYAGDSRLSGALGRVASSYGAFLNDQSKLPLLTESINSVPKEVASLIPSPTRVREQKEELAEGIQQTRMVFQ